MGEMASQITNLTIVFSTVYSGKNQRNIKAPRHWPLCGEFTGLRWIPAQMASNVENISICWRHNEIYEWLILTRVTVTSPHTSYSDLTSHELQWLHLTRVTVTSPHTSYSDLTSHELQWPHLTRVTVTSPHTSYSDLTSHELQWLHLTRVTVTSPHTSYSDLTSHELQWPHLTRVTVTSPHTSYSDFTSHELRWLHLTRATLSFTEPRNVWIKVDCKYTNIVTIFDLNTI